MSSSESDEDDCVLFGSESDSDELKRHEVFCFSAPSNPGAKFSLIPSIQMPASQVSLSIEDACTLVRGGDIVLFNGTGTTSVLVRWFTPSIAVSHVAIVIMVKNDNTGQIVPFLLESVRHRDKNIDVNGKYSDGVRVVPMRERIATYNGFSIAVRFLQCRRDPEVIKSTRNFMNDHLLRFASEYMYRGYNQDWRDFLNARVPFLRNTATGSRFDKRDSEREFFCSELLGQCFIEAGMLDGTAASASSYSTDSFYSAGNIQFTTPPDLIGADLRYSPEMYIDFTAAPK